MDPKPTSERSQDIIQEVKPEFIHEGDESSPPIPRDSPNVKSPDITVIEAKNRTKGKGDKGYDRCSNAQKMMKGEEVYWGSFTFTDISLPFSTSTPIKGAYICIGGGYYFCPPSYLIFSLTSSKGEKMFKKYEFPELENDSWFFLPIDLSDVILCEITGKGRKKEYFAIDSLFFISREEIPEEIKACEAREKLWSEAPVVKPEFVKEGIINSIPISCDDPNVIDPSFSKVKGKNDTFSKESEEYDQSSAAQKMLKGEWDGRFNYWYCKESEEYDQSEEAQRMLKGEGEVTLSHLSIPFPSPSPMKGAYICVDKDSSSPSLLFTFTDCDGKKTRKKYEFTESKNRYEWHFLLIDLDNVVLCEIEGKGRWRWKNSRSFAINSLVFLQQHIFFGNVEYIYKGDFECIPIPRDDPTFIGPDFTAIKAIEKQKEEYEDMSNSAQTMMKGEFGRFKFFHISIPFKSSTSIKCAYICLSSRKSPSLTFTFTSSNGNKMSYLYKFDEFSESLYCWFKLSIYLSDVVSCDIKRDEEERENFDISSLAFYREDTSDEYIAREKQRIYLEELWLKSSPVKPMSVTEEFVDSLDDTSIINPSFSMVKGKNDVYCKESEKYDRSSRAQRMLKGECSEKAQKMLKVKCDVRLSHLSIPFPSPSPMKGAYICVNKNASHTLYSSPSLLFTFTLSNGKKISKKYEVTEIKLEYDPEDLHKSEYYFFLPIDLPKVIICEIQGKGTWKDRLSRSFQMTSLIFIKGEDIPPLPSDSTKLIKHDSFTLTSSATITPQCIIGHGGFGEVLLVKVEGIPIPCVLKKMLREADEKVVKECRHEFKMQRKLFNNPKCFNRIPRPLYILDLLDADMKGVYGFIMEYCAGGSVSAFARSWCDDGKYVSDIGDADDSCDYDIDITHIDPMRLNPVKVCSLCVGMIECLDDVLRAKKSLVHRDVKPDNFLVRVDHDSKKCTIVLSDLGMVQILDSISSSASSKSATHPILSEKKEKTSKPRNSRCGTLVYNSYETLCEGRQTQKSDGYSLGMSILSLFLCEHPFTSLPKFSEVYRKVCMGEADDFDLMKLLKRLVENDMCQRLSRSPLFKSLLTIEDGKYKPVHVCLNEIFTGLTRLDKDERMSVHEARKKVQSIKDLLPKIVLPQIGEGFICPSIEDIIERQLAEYDGNAGIIEEVKEDESEKSGPIKEIRATDMDSSDIHPFPKAISIPIPSSVSTKVEDELECEKYQKEEISSGAVINRLCRLGSGGFSEVFLVTVNDIPLPCVLKKFRRKNQEAIERVKKRCKMEFDWQNKLFLDSECLHRIPRPLYILDTHSEYQGFIMEYCAGVKVSALCVGMIECLDDVFRAKKSLVHRDVKPDNFLVRVDHDPQDGNCTVVLSDFGFVKSQENIRCSRCGTFVYNSYEALQGFHSQKSDGYSLGMSILSLFLCEQPFTSLPIYREVYRKVCMGEADDFDLMKLLKRLVENDMCQRLSRSSLFQSLLTIEDGKYKPVHACLNEVFTGLTKKDEDERMSVHEARKKVQSIKDLLPKISTKCPQLDDIIFYYRQIYPSSKFIRDIKDDKSTMKKGIPLSSTKTTQSEMEKWRSDGNQLIPLSSTYTIGTSSGSNTGTELQSTEKDTRDKEQDEPFAVSLPSKIQSTEKENRDIPSYLRESQASRKDSRSKDNQTKGKGSGFYSGIINNVDSIFYK
ncbi:hypothetical protein ADUPG1_007154 [Aduncisulcus paluster]|uniref:Protein kinase domain-containing protein n=1 Tax=Aduncisulcus paluster TaxID=2918883 RepID=A0ABQ5KKY4_9EUKA|nr:hypothetical protein ADUPG1_007154 [Aduncisulcus paluster]